MSKQAIQAAKQRKRWLLLPAIMAVALAVFGGNYLASGDAQASAKPGITGSAATTPDVLPQRYCETADNGCGSIYHLDPFGEEADDHVANNLIGHLHQVCAEGIFVDGIWPADGPQGELNWKIEDANTHGNPNVLGATTRTDYDCDNPFRVTDNYSDYGTLSDASDTSVSLYWGGGYYYYSAGDYLAIGNEIVYVTYADYWYLNVSRAQCGTTATAHDTEALYYTEGNCYGNDSLLTYYSSTPGEQFITVVNDAGSLVIDANGECTGGCTNPEPLIKEWNLLDPTVIRTGTSETSTDVTDGSATQHVIWDDYDEEYVSITSTVVYEHVHGHHNDGSPGGWSGEVIGALVNISVDGSCGRVAVRGYDYDDGQLIVDDNPDYIYNGTYWLWPGDDATFVSTGDPFEIEIGADDCYNGNGDWTEITIETEYDNALGSTQPGGDVETFRVDYVADAPVNKQPLLAWAGQRVVLEHSWLSPDGECRWYSNAFDEALYDEEEEFIVQYAKQNGPGSFTSGVWGDVDSEDVYLTGEDAWVLVDADGEDPYESDNCISRVIYESQDPGEVDVVAFVVNCPPVSGSDYGCNDDEEDIGAISQQVPFLIYYMKIEDVKVGIVPGTFNAHNNGSDKGGIFTGTPGGANPWNSATDVTSQTSNVSADVLIRAKVRGWFVNSNPSGRAAIAGNPALGLDGRPADRWIMPDDWATLAGGALAEEFRPNYDIMFAPDSGFACDGAEDDGADDVVAGAGSENDVTPESCRAADGQGMYADTTLPGIDYDYVQGPFSLLDNVAPTPFGYYDGVIGTFAPYNYYPYDQYYRNTILPDGDVDEWDAPMPPALVTFRLTGSGFLVEAPKANVYSQGTNAFYTSNIPAEPGIRKLNSDGSGYLISSWDLGYPYAFWSAVKHGSAVYSAAGADAAKTTASASKVATGGYTSLSVYSDNHGESMVIVNGDAGLTMDACNDAASKAANGIVSLTGYFCEKNDKVGNSKVNAVADYPDKRKHAPVGSNEVSVDWTWGGIKQVDVVAGEADQFKYVVFTVTDRDGFCTPPAGATSLHPVNGEAPDFAIDSGEGIILTTSNGAPTTRQTAIDVPVFDNAATGAVKKSPVAGCEAWIKVSNSLLGILNVIVIANDPEGTVTFDRVVDFNNTTSYVLTFRWSLVTWTGANNMAVADALGAAKDQVTAVYGWKQATQEWLGWFPGTAAPGAIDLTALTNGAAYWVAIDGDPSSVTWTWTTNVN